jgi:hypothetical protein
MAEPDNPVDFLRNRRAAAAAGGGNGGDPSAGGGGAAPPPAEAPQVEETFDNPTHPGTLEDMEPGDLMAGTGRPEMYEAEKPAPGGGDGAAVIGGGAPPPSGGGAGGAIGKLLMVAVFGALLVGTVFFMTRGSAEPADDAAPEPVDDAAPEPVAPVPTPEVGAPGPAPGPAPVDVTPTPPPPPPGPRCARAQPCPAADECKVAGTCQEDTGTCSDQVNAPDGTSCDDGDAATSNDSCSSGACRGNPAEDTGGGDECLPAACSTAGQIGIAVQITTAALYADEIQWDIDGGAAFPTPGTSYEGGTSYCEGFCLPAGDHTIHYMDSYGDGWGEGAYWSLLDSSGELIAGGSEDGVVTQEGGETDFTLVVGGPATSSVEAPVTITIFASGSYSDEIQWSIDGGERVPPVRNRVCPPFPASASLRLCVSASLRLCVSASLRLCVSASLPLPLPLPLLPGPFTDADAVMCAGWQPVRGRLDQCEHLAAAGGTAHVLLRRYLWRWLG